MTTSLLGLLITAKKKQAAPKKVSRFYIYVFLSLIKLHLVNILNAIKFLYMKMSKLQAILTFSDTKHETLYRINIYAI